MSGKLLCLCVRVNVEFPFRHFKLCTWNKFGICSWTVYNLSNLFQVCVCVCVCACTFLTVALTLCFLWLVFQQTGGWGCSKTLRSGFSCSFIIPRAFLNLTFKLQVHPSICQGEIVSSFCLIYSYAFF